MFSSLVPAILNVTIGNDDSCVKSTIAAALTFRGAEVHALLCDGAMTACAECDASLYPDISRFVDHGPSRDLCRDCTWPAARVYAQLGLTMHRYSEWLAPEDRAEARRLAGYVPFGDIRTLTIEGLAIGEHAWAGALRFFAVGSLDDEAGADSEERGETADRHPRQQDQRSLCEAHSCPRDRRGDRCRARFGCWVRWGTWLI